MVSVLEDICKPFCHFALKLASELAQIIPTRRPVREQTLTKQVCGLNLQPGPQSL